MDTVVREVLQTRRLMLSPIRGCVETSNSVYKDLPILGTEKQSNVRVLFLNSSTITIRKSQSVHNY